MPVFRGTQIAYTPLQSRHFGGCAGEGTCASSYTLSIVSALVLGVTTYASPGAARSHEPADLTGTYSCRGQDIDGKSYEATVQDRQTERRVLSCSGSLDDEVVALGMGVVHNDVLAVAYFTGSPGVVAYHVAGEGRLVGQWTIAGAEGIVASETLTRTADTPSDSGATCAPAGRRPAARRMALRRPAPKSRPS